MAANGCTLLSNCGFENNHESASGFDKGDASVWLQNFRTLIGCSAYLMFNQTRLVEAFVVGQFVMIGCARSGDARASRAGLARIGGEKKGHATIVSPSGAIEYVKGFEALEVGAPGAGGRFGSHWQSPNLARLGVYRLWVDGN